MIIQKVEKSNTKSKNILQKVLTSTESRVIIAISNERRKAMSKKGNRKSGSKNPNSTEKIVLATAIIKLIHTVFEIIQELMD